MTSIINDTGRSACNGERVLSQTVEDSGGHASSCSLRWRVMTFPHTTLDVTHASEHSESKINLTEVL